MLNRKELNAETKALGKIMDSLEKKLELLQSEVDKAQKATKEFSKFIADHYYDMDNEEALSHRDLLENLQLNTIEAEKLLFVTQKQHSSAFFGRIDFKADDQKETMPLRIGIASLENPEGGIPLVLDWRAPASSLYYDYEIGRGSYVSPMGVIEGDISLKRQYKIAEREIVWAFDSSLTIGDDILREALGQSSSAKMREIVSTIQKEQNKIIRADEYTNLLVQGVAGSGKTSIALHRVAYLLYKNKIPSTDILIISPSKVFSNYISDVLPELGENNAVETTFEEIARGELEGLVHFESREDMLEALLSGDLERADEVNYKASFEFYESLKSFLSLLSGMSFHAKDIKFDKQVFSAEKIDELFNKKYLDKTPAVRIEWITDYILDQIDASPQEAKALTPRIKKLLLNMFEVSDILTIYKLFLSAIGMKTDIMVKKEHAGHFHEALAFENVAPVLYIKDYFLGLELEKSYKFIIIDEMQDYSPIMFDIINKLFKCPKTILGDIYQSIEKTLDQKYLLKLAELIGNCNLIRLKKSYRSTLEIAIYAQNIIGLTGAENVSRHGSEVKELTSTKAGLVKKILSEYERLHDESQRLAIIVPTNKLAEELYAELGDIVGLELATDATSEISASVVIIPTSLSKGLEFDSVIAVVPKKQNRLLQNAFYITATRALHNLSVIKI